MNRDAHVIEIESIVLDGVDPKGPGVRALVEAETRRVLFGMGLSSSPVARSEVAVAQEVARSVDYAVKGGRGNA